MKFPELFASTTFVDLDRAWTISERHHDVVVHKVRAMEICPSLSFEHLVDLRAGEDLVRMRARHRTWCPVTLHKPPRVDKHLVDLKAAVHTCHAVINVAQNPHTCVDDKDLVQDKEKDAAAKPPMAS